MVHMIPLIDPVEPEKLHQPVFRQTNNKLTVSCVCKRAYGKHVRIMNGPGDSDYCYPMDWPKGDDWKQVYNRPDNHSQPFTYEWMIA